MMKPVEILYTKAAEKFFRTHEDVRDRYEDALREMIAGEHPEKVDVKRIKGRQGDYYRIRLGQWRVIYTVVNGKVVVVETILAGARGDVYKKL
ncbi:MAG: type II toxin-antitoxin system RelE/ParE family toxin [Clostridia bacterium]|nr:type II toxin-antitoxin system RelE/ParE family toxin [Clostridia bacterium]